MIGGSDILVLADDNPVKGYNLPMWLVDPPLGLSGKAFGFLIYLVTRPANTRLSLDALAQRFSDRKTAIASGLVELEDAGYLFREHLRSNGGTFSGWKWYVSFMPRFLGGSDSDGNEPEPGNRNLVTETQIRETGIWSDKPDSGNRNLVRLTRSGKPESGAVLSGNAVAVLPVETAVKQDVTTDIANQIVSGTYHFSSESAGVEDTPLLSSTVNTVKQEVVKGSAEGKTRRPSDDRPLTTEQQLIWDSGWAKGYELLTSYPPSEPSRAVRIDFKRVCTILLAATKATALSKGVPNATLAAHLLYSIFERSQQLDKWQRDNCLAQPALFAKNFDAIRNALSAAKRGQGAPRKVLSPEEFARQQQAKIYQNAVARGFIRPGESLVDEPAAAPTPSPAPFGPPRRQTDEDLVPDGE